MAKARLPANWLRSARDALLPAASATVVEVRHGSESWWGGEIRQRQSALRIRRAWPWEAAASPGKPNRLWQYEHNANAIHYHHPLRSTKIRCRMRACALLGIPAATVPACPALCTYTYLYYTVLIPIHFLHLYL